MLMISFAIATRILRKDFETGFLQALLFFLVLFDTFLFLAIVTGLFTVIGK